jgi:PhoH-like ATPase
MEKTFVLDTNVLLHSPEALVAFEDNNIIVPGAVVDELDDFKKGKKEINFHARTATNKIEKYRKKGNLNKGVKMNNGGILRIELNHRDIKLPPTWELNKADHRILQICKALKKEEKNVVLISKDTNLRIKADAMGLNVEDYNSDKAPKLNNQYKGRKTVHTSQKTLNKFFEQGYLNINEISVIEEGKQINYDFTPNEFITIETNDGSGLGKINNDCTKIEQLQHLKEYPYGVTPRNSGQKFMQEALMADVNDIPLVLVKGPAGTAKTFYSLATGLQNIVLNNDDKFRKILVCRPNELMGDDLGYLPGNEKEKIKPLMRPIYDNLEVLVDSNEDERYKNEEELQDKIAQLFEKQYIDMQAVGYLRGRSIVKHWLIIDEAQNLTREQAKGIVTRAGKGTKVIMVGDPEQIDNPYLSERTNGLSYASESMKGSSLCAQITMENKECVRSKLAQEAADMMD